jgi:hypothetical protein
VHDPARPSVVRVGIRGVARKQERAGWQSRWWQPTEVRTRRAEGKIITVVLAEIEPSPETFGSSNAASRSSIVTEVSVPSAAGNTTNER